VWITKKLFSVSEKEVVAMCAAALRGTEKRNTNDLSARLVLFLFYE